MAVGSVAASRARTRVSFCAARRHQSTRRSTSSAVAVGGSTSPKSCCGSVSPGRPAVNAWTASPGSPALCCQRVTVAVADRPTTSSGSAGVAAVGSPRALRAAVMVRSLARWRVSWPTMAPGSVQCRGTETTSSTCAPSTSPWSGWWARNIPGCSVLVPANACHAARGAPRISASSSNQATSASSTIPVPGRLGCSSTYSICCSATAGQAITSASPACTTSSTGPRFVIGSLLPPW